MTTTFLKRQKEMKRQEKQREKAERRKEKKLAKHTGNVDSIESADPDADLSGTSEAHPDNESRD